MDAKLDRVKAIVRNHGSIQPGTVNLNRRIGPISEIEDGFKKIFGPVDLAELADRLALYPDV